MAGVIGSDDAVPGAGMSSSTITPGNSFIGTMSIESIDPVIRNGLEGDIKDFGPVKVVPSLCPDIMTIISYILNTDIKTKAEVSIFCKNSRPDEGWYDNIIETLGAELNYSYVQRPIHDYMLSFMTVKGNKYLYSLDLDSSNILALRMIKDSRDNIYMPNIHSLNDLVCDVSESENPLDDMAFCGSELYLQIIREVTGRLNCDHKYFIDDGAMAEYRPVVVSDCGADNNVSIDEFKDVLSDKIAMLTKSEGEIDVTLYEIGFEDFPNMFQGVTLCPYSNYHIPDPSKELYDVLDLLVPVDALGRYN